MKAESYEYLSAFECYGCISANLNKKPSFQGIWCNRPNQYRAYDSPDALVDLGRCKKYSTGVVKWDIRAIP
jgi:hypothetical protein